VRIDSIGVEAYGADEGPQEKHETPPLQVQHVNPQGAGLSQRK
jgi:hypothetical protein